MAKLQFEVQLHHYRRLMTVNTFSPIKASRRGTTIIELAIFLSSGRNILIPTNPPIRFRVMGRDKCGRQTQLRALCVEEILSI